MPILLDTIKKESTLCVAREREREKYTVLFSPCLISIAFVKIRPPRDLANGFCSAGKITRAFLMMHLERRLDSTSALHTTLHTGIPWASHQAAVYGYSLFMVW